MVQRKQTRAEELEEFQIPTQDDDEHLMPLSDFLRHFKTGLDSGLNQERVDRCWTRYGPNEYLKPLTAFLIVEVRH